MKRNEDYIGSTEEKNRIDKFLNQKRQEKPERFINHTKLSDAIDQDLLDINWELFETAIKKAELHFKEIDPNFYLMPYERYLVSSPRSNNLGGFYGRPTGGYYYFNDVAFSTTLDKDRVPNKELRTLELVRNFLHDSLHASTYRTFRIDNETGLIFRHQYGINFRNPDRISYSAPNLNEKSPDTINLNTWMDALVHIHASNFMNENYSNYFSNRPLDLREQEIWNEVINMKFDKKRHPKPIEFYETVINPTKAFLEKWGEDFLLNDTLKAMLTGDITSLKQYFDQTLMIENSWEKLFRQKAYKDIDHDEKNEHSNDNKKILHKKRKID